MQPVIIESPYTGFVETNVEYAQQCMHDALLKGEAPYASHLLYTQPNVLDDTVPKQRELGINAGFVWKHMPNVITLFYIDLGWYKGMHLAFDYCEKHNLPYEIRMIKS